MPLRDMLDVLRTRWRIIALSVLLVVGVTAAVTATITPQYTTSTRIYFSAKKVAADDQGSGVYVLTQTDLNTFAQVLSSPIVLEPLRAAVGLPEGAPISVTAAVSETVSVLDITATNSDPQMAADIANATGPVIAKAAAKFSPLLSATGSAVESTVITPAPVPTAPTSPDVKRNLLIALIAGLGLGIGLAMARHSLDNKVRDEDDIAALSDRPVLASLPTEPALKNLAAAAGSDFQGVHAEAVRRLRTNLMFVDVTTEKRSFVVTSAMPGDGKTTTAITLGRAVADAGMKVLLVDADLRNPSIARSLGMEGSVGLTTALLRQASSTDVIQQWGTTSMYVLPSGVRPPNPSELLGSAAMDELFGKLQAEFDFVIVDSPPIVPVTDAAVLERLTGGIVLVVATGMTRKKDLASALKSLDTAGSRVAGFVRNFVPLSWTEVYRYGRYYATGKPRTRREKRDLDAMVEPPRRRRFGRG